MTKCGLGQDEYNAQSEFVDRLQWCAQRWDIHIHLVCHLRKSSGQGRIDSKADIIGTGNITNLADNVFILRRNKAKEAESVNRQAGLDYDDGKLLEPCAYLSVEKNREYGHEPTFGLWYHHASGQFLPNDGPPLPALEVI